MAPDTEVLLCTYNGERYVRAQLASIVRQSQLPTRISIRDDASTDGTVAALRATIAGLDPIVRDRIRLTVNPVNVGYVANFAHAIQQAEADLLFLCDQDDVWAPAKVATLADALGEDGPDLAFSDGVLIDAVGRPLGGRGVFARYGLSPRGATRFRDEAFGRLLRRNYVNGAALAVRRQAAQAALPVPLGVPHDYWLALWCALHGGVTAVPAPLYRYRQHGANVIGFGGSHPLHLWLGIWRHPDRPRELESARWRAMAPRLLAVAPPPARRAVHAKLAWLARVLARDRGRTARLAYVVGSALRGDYRSFAPPGALPRDLVSTLKGTEPAGGR